MSPACRNQVTVRTSDIRGAGTDAGVSVVLYGTQPDGTVIDSGRQVLDNSANNFERGQVDTFFVKCKDLGPLSRLVVGGA